MPLAALMILGGFWLWWPLGLAILAVVIVGHWLLWPFVFVALAFIIGSRHMGCWSHNGTNRWDNKMQRMQEKMDRVRAKMDGFKGGGDWWGNNPPSSGNRAFAVLRAAAEKVCVLIPPKDRPPVLMLALHIWSLSHGVASLFGRGDAARRTLPMSPEELLEAGVLVYLRGLGVVTTGDSGRRA